MTKNVAIPVELHAEAKAHVKANGQKLEWFVSNAVREHLKRENKFRDKIKSATRSGVK